MKVKPLDDRVLVEVAVEEVKTASGLYIPDTAKEKPRMGKVVAVGTDEDLQELIKVGDNILFAKYGGEDITVGNDEYKIVQRGDILAVIED
ncbi:MAG: co-chaperone GroES [Melioribacteraceae bacterium]|jgi:chaperonin GroES|nr:co-chaperone GroES [Melioribacteraceae bacterium]